MLGLRRRGTVIGNGLKVTGNVTAEGLIVVNGRIEGDLNCTSLFVSPTAEIMGSITAERVVVNGRVEGPIQGDEVVLKPQANVVGDIQHRSLVIQKGASFVGRAAQVQGAGSAASKLANLREVAS
jgi:cytoskeletal protein CcmA (bactofilin family)